MQSHNKMKKLFFLFNLLLLSFLGNSQSVQHTLKVYDIYGRPLKNTLVSVTETVTREVISKKTNNNGQVIFEIDKGKLWQIGLLKIPNNPMWQIKLPKKGKAIERRSITYDPERFEH